MISTRGGGIWYRGLITRHGVNPTGKKSESSKDSEKSDSSEGSSIWLREFRTIMNIPHFTRDPEFLAINPPPRGEEYSRPASPAPSDHSSRDGENKWEDYLADRNAAVEKYFEDDKTKVKCETNWEKVRRQRLTRGGSITYSSYLEKLRERKAILEDDEGTSSSGDSIFTGMGRTRNEAALLRDIVKKETGRISKEKENLKAIPIYGSFSHITFQKIRNAKWVICQLERFERILRGELFQEKSSEWICLNEDGSTDMESMKSRFEGVFGPIDKKHPSYRNYLMGFTLTRFEMELEMMGKEENLLRWLLKNDLFNTAPEQVAAMADEVAEMKKDLESKMLCMESTLDLNYYTTALDLEYFVLPRRSHSIEDYKMIQTETETLTEFQIDKKSQLMVEGYRPTLFDIGLDRPDFILEDTVKGWGCKVLPEQSRSDACFKEWSEAVSRIKEVMWGFKDGVAPKVFLKALKEKYGEQIRKAEKTFGRLNTRALVGLTDIVFRNDLDYGGQAPFIILFPSEMEGTIVTLKEILVRFWKRLKFLLKHEEFIPLDKIGALYENYYGSPLSPLINWGFANAEEFVQFCFKVIPEEMDCASITMISTEKVLFKEMMAEKEIAAKKKSDSTSNLDEMGAAAAASPGNATASTSNSKKTAKDKLDESLTWKERILKNNWYKLKEPLPKNAIFRIVNKPKKPEKN